MVDLLADTWHSRELPLLVEVARRLEESRGYVPTQEAGVTAGLTPEQTERAVVALADAGLVAGINEPGVIGLEVVSKVSPEARRLVGLWPSEDAAADRLLAALDALVERASDPDERSRLLKVRDGLAGAGRDVVVGVATAVLTGQLPG